MSDDFSKINYDHYRPGFPAELFERLVRLDIGQRGQRVLDLGTGTGNMARSFARRGCDVVGLDPSQALLEEAKRIDQTEDVRIEYVAAPAERSSLAAASFDVVSAGQSWRWFDTHKTVREVKRLLRPGGHLVVAQLDWIPLPGNAVEVTEQLIDKYNPEWRLGGGTGLHPEWLKDVRAAGFARIETFSFDLSLSFTHEAWRGRVRASAGVRASLKPDMLARFDENLRGALAEKFADEPLTLPHCVWALCGRMPS